MRQYLSEPYPFYFKGRELVSILIIIFAMSFLFNYLFEPFNVYRPEHKYDFFWICFFHSLSAVIAAGLYSLIAGIWISEDNWKVRNEIAFIAGLFLMIGISQFIIRDLIYENPENWSWVYFFEEIRNTFLIGILFVLILVPLNFLRLNHRHKQKSDHFERYQLDSKEDSKGLVPLTTQLKSDDFLMDPENLIFARAEGNYLEIYMDNDPEERLVKRMTLKDLEKQLDAYPFIMKTHRSYLVNLHKIDKMKGNAQGYKLFFTSYKDYVPVSRGMIQNFEKHIQVL
ncbi:MAG: LytTR family DNA-binding domain-containing protein [Bacteroidota bacterium]